MAEVQPPTFVTKGCYTPQQFRLQQSSTVCSEGVVGVNDLMVTTDGSMSVQIASGKAFIQGDRTQEEGMYWAWNNGADSVPVIEPGPTDDRIDIVVAQILEPDVGENVEWEIEVLMGQPSPVPSPPDLPPSALPLAQVRVRAGATTLAASDITDLRQQYQFCPGHTSDPVELGVVDLNDVILPGRYTQSSNTEAEAGANYPPASVTYGGEQAGFLTVEKNALGTIVKQTYSEYRVDFWILWERNYDSGSWGPWFAIGGPGDWTTSAIAFEPGVSSITPVDGSTYRGVNRRGSIGFQFTWTGGTLTADSNANYPDTLLGSITDPAYRPPRNCDFPIIQSGVATLWCRISAAGSIHLTHASYPGQQFQNSVVYRLVGDWGPS